MTEWTGAALDRLLDAVVEPRPLTPTARARLEAAVERALAERRRRRAL